MPYPVAYLSEVPQNANSAPLTDIHVPESNTTLKCFKYNNTITQHQAGTLKKAANNKTPSIVFYRTDRILRCTIEETKNYERNACLRQQQTGWRRGGGNFIISRPSKKEICTLYF